MPDFKMGVSRYYKFIEGWRPLHQDGDKGVISIDEMSEGIYLQFTEKGFTATSTGSTHNPQSGSIKSKVLINKPFWVVIKRKGEKIPEVVAKVMTPDDKR